MRFLLSVGCLTGLLLMGCTEGGGEDVATPVSHPPGEARTYPVAPRLRNASAPLDTPTYEGSGQAMHPDVVAFPEPWHGFRYWMAMTPYPYDTAERENPSLLASNDGRSWSVPPGVTNPLVPPPPCDHNSDPDLVYDARTDELLLFYTEILRPQFCGPDTNVNTVKLIRSSDGLSWSEPETVLEFDLDRYPVYVSPAVVYRRGRFEMWMVGNNGALVYSASPDGEMWTPPLTLRFPDILWHIDVRYIPSRSEYWMLYATSAGPGGELRFARSSDGRLWEVCREPVLRPGDGWDNDRIYRSTFLYDRGSNRLRVWYSARSDEGFWGIGYTEGGHPGLLGRGC